MPAPMAQMTPPTMPMAAPQFRGNRRHTAYPSQRVPEIGEISPSYYSASEFELNPDHSSEGFPDSRGWRFLTGPKISPYRKDGAARAKQLARCYRHQFPPPPSWGPEAANGKSLFTYTKEARWTAGRTYSAEQLRLYADNCPRQLFCWVQQCPSQCNWRMSEDDNVCRWENCPLRSRKISPGWLRVAFDEYGMETSTGAKDPFKVAGTMHLWCFEQCFDLAKLYSEGKLFADLRSLPREENNRMSLAKDTDRDIMDGAFRPWFRSHPFRAGRSQVPMKHEDSLSYALVQHHLEAQAGARQSTRETRNSVRPAAHWKTMDVHKGNLQVFSKRQNRRKKEERNAPPAALNDMDSASQSADDGDVDTVSPTPLGDDWLFSEGQTSVTEGHPMSPSLVFEDMDMSWMDAVPEVNVMEAVLGPNWQNSIPDFFQNLDDTAEAVPIMKSEEVEFPLEMNESLFQAEGTSTPAAALYSPDSLFAEADEEQVNISAQSLGGQKRQREDDEEGGGPGPEEKRARLS
jgi:hypothetical protein